MNDNIQLIQICWQEDMPVSECVEKHNLPEELVRLEYAKLDIHFAKWADEMEELSKAM